MAEKTPSKSLRFGMNKPCDNCPYRKDAPLAYWDKLEFEGLLKSADDPMTESIYGCHKQNGCVCVGWLMFQDDNRLPSIPLRLKLSQDGITREYLDALSCGCERFGSVAEMCKANFPNFFT